MDTSTEGVTLHAGFIFDVLSYYSEGWMSEVVQPLFEMTAHLDRGDPTKHVDVKLYNDVCSWIEEHVGEASIRNAGRDIGNRVYEAVVASGDLRENATPVEALHGMMRAAQIVVHDPKGRGFVALEESPTHMRIRLTQTFNCVLQEGLMATLVARAGGLLPRVVQEKCVKRGDEFCEYHVNWRPGAADP